MTRGVQGPVLESLKTDEPPIAEPKLTETDEALQVPLEDSQAKPSDPSSETPAT